MSKRRDIATTGRSAPQEHCGRGPPKRIEKRKWRLSGFFDLPKLRIGFKVKRDVKIEDEKEEVLFIDYDGDE